MSKIFYSFDGHDLPAGNRFPTADAASGETLDMHAHINRSLIDLRELHDLLHRHHAALTFHLAIYEEGVRQEPLADIVTALCRPPGGQPPCSQRCLQQWEDLVTLAMVSNRPQLHSCAQGLLGFAIPLPGDRRKPACLLGGGVRERPTAPAAAAGPRQHPAGAAPALPTATRAEAQRLVEQLAQLLPQVLDQQLQKLSLTHISERLAATREIVRELPRCSSDAEAIALVSEALVMLFDLPRLIFILQQTGRRAKLHTSLGIEPASVEVNDDSLTELVEQAKTGPLHLSGKELATALPGLEDHTALLLPLQEGNERLGLLLVLDVEPHPRDLALIELLSGRLAARLLHLRQEAALRQERHLSGRMVNMISSLALASNREAFLHGLLEMSAELANATSGSLMLFDEYEQKLRIAVAKGMSPPLARSMSVSLGEGIAGRVARSDTPLLVNDIEHDSRIKAPNRPRFRTKSFISLPLRSHERPVGVLNLADRQDGHCFTEANLQLVLSFASQAIMLLDRTGMVEQIAQLEKLAVTDPLTGLYNRRFLEPRLEEELSRSQRHDKQFSLIMADLDNFKYYNDICGHPAGDKALRKVATALRRAAREMDVVVRYGGEEFCLILPVTGVKEAAFVAERLRRTIEAEVFPGETNLPLGRLTISLGIATYPEDGDTLQQLLTAADLALYRAKELGRNRSVSCTPTLTRNQPARLHLTERS